MKINQKYTQNVKILRVALPLLALMSIIALIAWPILNQEEIPQEMTSQSLNSDKPIGIADDALQMIKPEFTGLDMKNRPYIITAETIYQGSTKEADMTLIKPKATLDISKEQSISLESESGVYKPSQESLTLTGAVTLFDQTGYHLKTREIFVDLSKSTAISQTKVEGRGPIGSIDAHGIKIDLELSPIVHFMGPATLTIYPRAIE